MFVSSSNKSRCETISEDARVKAAPSRGARRPSQCETAAALDGENRPMRLACGMPYCRVVLALVTVVAMLASAPARANDALRLHLYWKHQAQFAGYYMAQSRGYYSQAGLDVTFVESGPGIQPLLRLAKGDVDLSIGWLPQAL